MRRGSATISVAPRLTAFLIQVAATGWFTVGFAPITRITSASATSATGFDTAPEPMPSSSAATEEAWHSRVQWSTLFVPNPVRTSFWNRYASSLLPLAEPNPASACGPCVSRIRARPPAATDIASSQLASRNASRQFAGTRPKSGSLGTPSRRISGTVSRSGLAA